MSVNKTEMHSDYQSVDKQTGINAGKGGFDITVGMTFSGGLLQGAWVLHFLLLQLLLH